MLSRILHATAAGLLNLLKLSKDRFLSQYRPWKEAILQGKTNEAEKYRKIIRAMGLLALEPMMETLETDTDVLPMIPGNRLNAGAL
jgi:hypothetical protein